MSDNSIPETHLTTSLGREFETGAVGTLSPGVSLLLQTET